MFRSPHLQVQKVIIITCAYMHLLNICFGHLGMGTTVDKLSKQIHYKFEKIVGINYYKIPYIRCTFFLKIQVKNQGHDLFMETFEVGVLFSLSFHEWWLL